VVDGCFVEGRRMDALARAGGATEQQAADRRM